MGWLVGCLLCVGWLVGCVLCVGWLVGCVLCVGWVVGCLLYVGWLGVTVAQQVTLGWSTDSNALQALGYWDNNFNTLPEAFVTMFEQVYPTEMQIRVPSQSYACIHEAHTHTAAHTRTPARIPADDRE